MTPKEHAEVWKSAGLRPEQTLDDSKRKGSRADVQCSIGTAALLANAVGAAYERAATPEEKAA